MSTTQPILSMIETQIQKRLHELIKIPQFTGSNRDWCIVSPEKIQTCLALPTRLHNHNWQQCNVDTSLQHKKKEACGITLLHYKQPEVGYLLKASLRIRTKRIFGQKKNQLTTISRKRIFQLILPDYRFKRTVCIHIIQTTGLKKDCS